MIFIFDKFKATQKKNNEILFDTVVNMVTANSGLINDSTLNKNSDIYSAITQISSDVASTPINATNQVVGKNLNYQFVNTVMIQTLMYGNCYVLPNENFKLVDNSSIEIQIDDNNNVTYLITDNDTNETRTYSSKEVLHFRINPSDSNGLQGISPLVSLRETLAIQDNANKVLNKFYSQGIHGSLVLNMKTKLNKDQKDEVRDKFVESMNNNLGAIITDSSMDINTLNNNFDGDILKVIQNTDYLSKQVAKAFSVPNYVLGVEDNHSNQEQVQNAYNSALINIYEPIIESELNSKLSGTYSFNNSKYLSLNDLINLKNSEVITADDIKKIIKI